MELPGPLGQCRFSSRLLFLHVFVRAQASVFRSFNSQKNEPTWKLRSISQSPKDTHESFTIQHGKPRTLPANSHGGGEGTSSSCDF